ncbi:PKD domain-containing protein [Agriterribacter sp.]|uniref:PKD domain-containing protein n=1 Tax=Agriterribacter sp. TaxID=2821509 RepID=UPI002BCD3893|nr:PKD domain-containing protein [Agriterribacter sp.]HTN05782.1 PKD domain-containing protein [Agriterribacter sp.]
MFLILNSALAQVQKQTPVYVSLSTMVGGYYESLPVDYTTNPGKKYPLLIFIHGKGELGDGSASQLPRVLVNGPARLLNQGKFPGSFTVNGQKFSFIVISPQFISNSYTASPAAINDIITYCVQKYRVDEERIYITGLSMGGGFTWKYIGAYPERVAAAIPVCGSVTATAEAVNRIASANLPVWATHNSGDPTVSVNVTKKWINLLNAHIPPPDPKPVLTIFDVNSHDAWSKTYDPNFRENGLNVYEWMLSYKKGGSVSLPPMANAGVDQIITLPLNSVSLNGTESTAPAGTISSYAWTKVSGPSNGTISSPDSGKTTVTNLSEGTYQFQLKITDNNGGTSTAIVTIKVNPAPLPPVANAGVAQIITLPLSSVILDGTKSTAPSGSITTYQWSKLSGPAPGTIVTATNSSTMVNGLVEGVYLFQLKITDSNGGTSTAIVSITVNAAPIPPIADAGNDQTIDLPANSAVLDGSNSTAPAGSIINYEWSKLSGPSNENIINPSDVSTTVSGLTKGIYQFELKVTDNNGVTSSATITVTVNATVAPPVANAGNAQTITLPNNVVTLDGSTSSAPGDIVSGYAWRKVSGPLNETIIDPLNVTTLVTGLIEGVYKFELKVTNSKGLSSTAVITVTVNATPLPPVANAGIAQTIALPDNSVSLDGSGSTAPSGSISSYEWSKLSGPAGETIVLPGNAATTVTGLVEGVYIFELKVADNNGATSISSVTITVKAALLPPVANAGNAQTIVLPNNSVSLDGSGSTAPSGSISSYEWSKISGPSGERITAPDNAVTTVTELAEGTYQFELKVTGDNGLSSTSIITVTVSTAIIPPVANAGVAQTVALPNNTATLDGSASAAPSGSISSYKWIKISGPSGGDIADSENEITDVTGLTAGVYKFQLTVTDNNGATSTASVSITVKAAPLPPVAYAGVAQTITLPDNSVSLDGSGSVAPSGTISSYEWSKTSGPLGGVITSPGSTATTVTGLVEGEYTFELKVTDSNGSASVASVIVTVKAAPLPPVANAGIAQTITLPDNSVSLDGSGSTAPSGSISSYEWSKISGPSGEAITSPGSTATIVTGLVEGVYTFELKVTDNNGITSTASVIITVKVAPLPPVANAGSTQTITLPDNSVSLDGSGSTAPSGSISSYEWSKISGPSGEVITSPGSPVTTITGLAEGVYAFELKVTDNNGTMSTALVAITVKAAPLPPVANAGIAQTITLPDNNITLDGSGSSASTGNSIVSYRWSKIFGPVEGVIVDATGINTMVTGLIAGVYKFQLEVTDDKGGKATAIMTVTVKAAPPPPVADAGNDQTIILPVNSTSLDGSKSIASGGSITNYEWRKVSGPSGGNIINAFQALSSITGLLEGKYQYRLTVTDNRGSVATATIFITVKAAPLPPVANAGSAQIITLPANSITLNGTQSSAPAGQIKSYAWSKIAGPPSGAINNAANAVTAVDGLVAGTYVFQLKIIDNNSNSATASVTVIVNPAQVVPPVADAGTDISVQLPLSHITLDGSRSYARKGEIENYKWEKVSGPGTLKILNSNSAAPAIQNVDPGIYVFRLTVEDSNGFINWDDITITVMDETIILPPPVANAGETRTIPLTDGELFLDGGLSYAQFGTIEKYNWIMLSGPSGVKIDNAGSDLPLVSELITGEYVFELTVTDNTGKTDKATVKIIVTNAGGRPDLSPVIKAFPNPVYEIASIELQGPAKGRTSISVYDVNGKKVFKTEFVKDDIYVNHQLNMSGFVKGVYFIEVVIDYQYKSVMKVIKL